MRCLTHFFISLMVFSVCVFSPAKAQTVETLATLPGRPEALSIDSRGNIFTPIGPLGLLMKITPGGTVITLASGFSFPQGGGFDNNGNFYLSNWNTGIISKFTPDSTLVRQYAIGLSGPTGIIQSKSNPAFLYIANFSSNSVSKVSLNDSVTTPYISSNLINGPDGFAYDDQGNLYLANARDTRINRIDTNGVVTPFVTLNGNGGGIGYITFSNGNLYASGLNANKIYKITLSGDTSTIAGTGVAGYLDGPANIAQFNTPNGIIASLTGDTIFIGDPGNQKIRMLILNSVSIQNISSQAPDGFKLKQNYPNPFNPTTSIKFNIPSFVILSGAKNLVTLKVYNTLGREIATLVNKELQPGSYEYRFDGAGLPSGMYFYKLRGGEFSETKKMLLIK